GRNVDAYGRYRTMMTERLRRDTSPDRAVLRGLLGDWEETNRTFRDLAGAPDSERRLEAVKDIVNASGTRDPYADQLLAEAELKLNKGAQPYQGQMVTRRGTRGLVPIDRLGQDALRAQENLPPDAYWAAGQR